MEIFKSGIKAQVLIGNKVLKGQCIPISHPFLIFPTAFCLSHMQPSDPPASLLPQDPLYQLLLFLESFFPQSTLAFFDVCSMLPSQECRPRHPI